MSRATFTGTGFTSPPSTSSRRPMRTGENSPGMDMLARSACIRSPDDSTTSAPPARSVATARNGKFNSRNSRCPSSLAVSSSSRRPSVRPLRDSEISQKNCRSRFQSRSAANSRSAGSRPAA